MYAIFSSRRVKKKEKGGGGGNVLVQIRINDDRAMCLVYIAV